MTHDNIILSTRSQCCFYSQQSYIDQCSDVRSTVQYRVHTFISTRQGLLLSLDCLKYSRSFWIPVVGAEFLGCQWIHLLMLLTVCLEDLVSDLRVIHNNLLLPHLLDSVVVVALHRVVVLVDLNAQPAAGGEVVRLREVTQAVVLHSLQDVLHAHSLGFLISQFSCLRPDLVKAGHNEGSSLHLHLQAELAVDNLRGDLWLGHSKHLLPVNSPDVIHFLQACSVCW